MSGEEAEGGNNAEKFYRGTIVKLFPGNQTGIIRSSSGRELIFENAFVRMSGAARSFDDLHEGMDVGFDISRISKGLRVSVVHVDGDVPEVPQSEIPAVETSAPKESKTRRKSRSSRRGRRRKRR